MDKKAVRGWIMYDWANSAFATTILAAVLPVYYEKVAGAGLEGNAAETYWANTQSIAMLCVALLSPLAGALADLTGSKLRFLLAFTLLGACSAGLMTFAGEGDWLLVSGLLIMGTIGFTTGEPFTTRCCATESRSMRGIRSAPRATRLDMPGAACCWQ